MIIKETFLGFFEAKGGGTAEALSKTVIAYIAELGIDPLKIKESTFIPHDIWNRTVFYLQHLLFILPVIILI